MSRWFRFYDDVLNDPKVQRLPGDKFKAWVNLLCLASKNGGVLPPLPDCAFALRLTNDRMSALLDELYKAQLIDHVEVENAPMSYEPHNWNGRQFKSDVSSERVKRFRKRQRNVTETPPDTEQSQIQNRAEGNAPVVVPLEPPRQQRKKPVRSIPADFGLSDGRLQYAAERGFHHDEIVSMFEAFVNYHAAKGSQFADWDAAWRKWVLNQVEFKRKSGARDGPPNDARARGDAW